MKSDLFTRRRFVGSGSSSQLISKSLHHYDLGDLRIECDHQMPGLPPALIAKHPDVQLSMMSAADVRQKVGKISTGDWFCSSRCDALGRPLLKIRRPENEDSWLLSYSDGTEILIDNCGENIWYGPAEDLSAEDVLLCLTGPVRSFLNLLRGVVSLHASAVVVDGVAVAFVGQSESGKSTIAAALGSCGYSILADDLIPIRPPVSDGEPWLCTPDLPWLCLRGESLSLISAAADSPLRLKHDVDVEYLYLDATYEGFNWETEPIPLACLYLLESPDSSVNRVQISPATGHETVMSLVANTWTCDLTDSSVRSREFATLSSLVNDICVRRIIRPEYGNTLPEICDSVVQDFRRQLECSETGKKS